MGRRAGRRSAAGNHQLVIELTISVERSRDALGRLLVLARADSPRQLDGAIVYCRCDVIGVERRIVTQRLLNARLECCRVVGRGRQRAWRSAGRVRAGSLRRWSAL